MSARDIARLLNNESNLKIIERLKVRPYYPRELAMEMDLSEPFIVRRLKAMEEYDIVEGKWESEGNRRVKRYYLKDVKIQLGKDGFQMTSEEIPAIQGIDIKSEIKGKLLWLPLIALFMYGVLFSVEIIIIALSVLILWYFAILLALYMEFRFKTYLLTGGIYAAGMIILISMLVNEYLYNIPADIMAVLWLVFTAASLFILRYQGRYYQVEYRDMKRNIKSLVLDLESASIQKKIFYLPTVVKWKLNEYFKVI
ncbi:ArsR family transcriptional regulator [Methanocella sp. CWC-04]|uniref:ArsR family transcriptional regulator n=1 Tax=Methanooceanicella nereidis TaxID=2052831 RepID=A0AAP2RDF7_9EURY|nr:ArsR family transcriptional regulator [Methanocella sp. CWC-04]MCD1295239.1 ArsR family transcriptional regulator [Methanocella sp. CWC-04]